MNAVHVVPPNRPTLPIAKTLHGKSLLVTGVTGFVGKVWVSQLLHDFPQVGHIFLLVRPGREASAAERFSAVAESSPAFRPLRNEHGPELGAFLADKVTVLAGDCSQDSAGLTGEALKALKAVDAVVHFAGLTDFDPDPVKSLSANVTGALNMSRLARSIDAKLVHCSTCFVAGRSGGHIKEEVTPGVSPTGKTFDPNQEVQNIAALGDAEDSHDEPDEAARIGTVRARAEQLGWPNIYTFTKALAEHLIAGHDTATTIIRPSIVECAMHYPFTGWNEGLNTSGPIVWLLKGFFRHFPAKADNHHDVIPVDAVTRSTTLVLAAALRNEAEPVYQLGSSHSNPLTMGRAVELTNLAVRKDYGREHASRHERFIKRYFDTVHVNPDTDHLLKPQRLRRSAKGLRRMLDAGRISKVLPRPIGRVVGRAIDDQQARASNQLARAERSFGRLQKILDMFRPFVFDHDWVFENRNIRDLDDRLDSADASQTGWFVDDICWRGYWLDVLYPGLSEWCLPIIEGGSVADDGLMSPRLKICNTPSPQRTAQKAVS